MSEHGYHRAVSIQSAIPEQLPEIAALAGVIWRAHYPGIIPPEPIDYMLARMSDEDVMRQVIVSGIVYDRLLVNGALTG